MANYDGIGAALEIDDKTIEDIGKVEQQLIKLNDTADKLVGTFAKLSDTVGGMGKSLGGGETDKVVKSFNDLANAVVQVSKSGAALQGVTAGVDGLAKASERVKNPFEGYDLSKVRSDLEALYSLYADIEKEMSGRKKSLGFYEYGSESYASEKEKIASLSKETEEIENQIKALEKLEDKFSRNGIVTSKMVNEQTKALDNVQNKLSKAYDLPESTVSEVKRKINSIQKAMEDFEKKSGRSLTDKEIKQYSESIDRLKGKLNELNLASSNVMKVLAGVFSLRAAINFSKEMINIRSEFQMIERSLGVIIKDASAATTMFAEIERIAVKSPFSVQQMATQTKQLAAYRIETEKLIPTVKMLGDISAGVGVDMNRLILALGQVKAAEYLRGTELRQFSEAGVNMLGGLSKRFTEIYGKAVSVGEVMSMITKKMVTFADVEAVLQAETSAGGTFYRMQEIQSQTIQGMISNMKDRWQIALNEMGKDYEGLVTTVLEGMTRILDNSSALEVVFTSFTAAAATFGGLAALSGILGRLGKSAVVAAAKGKEYTAMLTSLAAKLVRLGPIVGAVAAGIGALTAVILVATKETRELNKIYNNQESQLTNLEGRYTKLTNIINDSNKTTKERQQALDDLKSEYGNLFPLEDIELSNVQALNAAYNENINILRQRASEEVKSQQIAALMSKEMVKNPRALEQELRSAGIDNFKGMEETLAAEMRNIGSMIVDGEINTFEEGMNAYVDALRGYFAEGSKELDKFNARLEDFWEANSITSTAISKYLRLRDKIQKIENTDRFGANFSQGYRDMTEQINLAKKALDDFAKANAGMSHAEYTIAISDYSKKLKDVLAEDMKKSNLADSEAKLLNEQLNEALSKVMPDSDALHIAKIQDKINKQFTNVKFKIGEGLLSKGETQSYEDYLSGLFDKLKAFRTEYDRAFGPDATNKGWNTQFVDEEQARTQIAALDSFLSYFKEYDKETKKAASSSTKNPFESYAKEIVKAYKEIDDADEKTRTSIQTRMENMASDLGRALPLNFLDNIPAEDIKDYIGSLFNEGRIDRDLSLELNVEVDQAELKKKINSITTEAELLFKKYSTGKKFIDYGLDVSADYSSVNLIRKMIDKENELRALGGKEAIDNANRIKEQRIGILASEQEEALKIMQTAQKKAGNAALAALEQGMADLAKVRLAKDRASEGEDALGLGVEQYKEGEVIAKIFKDIADAEWDAYKSTEMYVAAFGDLEGLSRDVIGALRQQLADWSFSDALNPTEIKTVQNALDKMDARMNTKDVKSFFDAISNGFKNISDAKGIENQLDSLMKAASEAVSRYNIAKEFEEQLRKAKEAFESDPTLQLASVNDTLMTATEVNEAYRQSIEATKVAMDEANAATEKYVTAQKKATSMRNQAVTAMREISQAYGKFADAVSSTIGTVKDFADAMGLSFSDETEEAISAFTNGFGLVGSAITSAISIVDALSLAINGATIAIGSLEIAVWPLLVAAAALAGIAAAIKIADNKAVKSIEAHKEAVESLEKQYDKLQDKMSEALSMTEMKQTYEQQIKNIKARIEKLNEAIDTENSRKGHKKEVQENVKEMTEEIESLEEEAEKAKETMQEMLGMPSNYQDVARDWAKSWLDAFKAGESGIDSLKESFDDLYDNLVVGQLWSKVMGDAVEKIKSQIDSVMDDGQISRSEAEQLKKAREELLKANEELKRLALDLGIEQQSTSTESDEGLQKGIQSITETTATALESLLNSTRYFVADTNTKVAEIALILASDAESGANPMLNELRSQTELINRIDGRLAGIIRSGHPKGGDGIRIFVD